MTTIAICDPLSLAAKELGERIGALAGTGEVRLVTTTPADVGTLTEVGGAAALVKPATAEQLDEVDLAFLCGPIERSRTLLPGLPSSCRAIILSPDATPADGTPLVPRVSQTPRRDDTGPWISPNPAVILLAHLLQPLRSFGLKAAVATVLEPVSTLDASAFDGLFEQARDLLSFRPVSAIGPYPRQVAFNLQPSASRAPIGEILGAVLSQEIGPAVQLLQAGVFHALSASLFVQLQESPTDQQLRAALSDHPVIEIVQDHDPSPIEAAASEVVLVAPPVADPGSDGWWLWATMDNLTRGAALNALEAGHDLLD